MLKMYSQNGDYEACPESDAAQDQLKVLLSVPAFVAGFFLYVILKLIGRLRRVAMLQKAPACMQKLLDSQPIRITTILLQTTAVVLVLDLLQTEYGSLLNCARWNNWSAHHFTEEWLLFVVNILFFMRVFSTYVANNFEPLFVDTVLDTQLFVQQVSCVIAGRYFYGFLFLVFHRFLNSYFIESLRGAARWLHLRSGTEVVLLYIQALASICMVAGVMHTAEQWSTSHGMHEDLEGALVTISSFREYIYFTSVTLSTVGYGDMSPTTTFGRIVVVLVILCCIPVFAATSERVVSWFTDSLMRFKILGDSLKYVKQRPRVIISGCMKAQVLNHFLEDFLHRNRSNGATQVIILDPAEPSTEVKEMMDKFWNVQYCMGDPLKRSTVQKLLGLKNMCRKCDVLICLGDNLYKNNADEVYIEKIVCKSKTTFPDLRIICVVNLQETQQAIRAIRGWSHRDVVICVEEVTQNMLAQNAAAPGAASVVASLMRATSCSFSSKQDELLRNFLHGLDMEIYISDDRFKSKVAFRTAAEHFINQGFTLLGARSQISGRFETQLFPENIQRGSQAVFIAQNAKQASSLNLGPPKKKVKSVKQVETVENSSSKPIIILQLDSHQKREKRIHILQDTISKINESCVISESNPRTWMTKTKNLENSDHIIIINTSQEISQMSSDVSCIRILNQIQSLNKKNSLNQISYSVHLQNQSELILDPSIQDCISQNQEVLHSLGYLVADDIVLQMVSSAYKNCETFLAVLDLIGSHSQNVSFSVVKCCDETTVRDLFLSLLEKQRILLAISCMPNIAQPHHRRIIVCPPLNMKVTQQDRVIVLKRFQAYKKQPRRKEAVEQRFFQPPKPTIQRF